MANHFLKKFLPCFVGALVIALSISILTATRATTHFYYEVTDLGIVGDSTGSIATGVNDSGQVVGYLTKDEPFHAFFWENGFMTDLGTLGGSRSVAYGGINNKGQVVGWADTKDVDYYNNPIFHAFLWSKSLGMTDLTASDRLFRTRAEDINEVGQVIITTENGTTFLWENGTTTNLCLNSSGRCDGNKLNNKGQVVGVGYIETGNYHAFLWNKGKISDLGTLGNPEGWSRAVAINIWGTVVGEAEANNNTAHAFRWKNGKMADLGTLGGRDSIALDINNQGKVVGRSEINSNRSIHAVLWQDGKMIDLNSQLPPNSGWVLEQASGINNRGQIVGYGLHNSQLRGFLLTPKRVTQ